MRSSIILLTTIGYFVLVPNAVGYESDQRTSLSMVEFMRLSPDDQRDVVIQVFEERLKHARNLTYEVDLYLTINLNADRRPGKVKQRCAFRRCRSWHLDRSFRVESDFFRLGNDNTATQWTNSGFDARDGIARSTVRFSSGRTPAGRIDTVPDRIIIDNRYLYWLDGSFRHQEEYLFHDLLRFQQDWEFETSGEDTVRLISPYQPSWAKQPGGKRIILLDPQKGFFPTEGESRWDAKTSTGKHRWRIERFVVRESKDVDGVWMPLKLHEEIASSASPETFAVYETNVVHIAHGDVTPADLHVPFTEGMEVVDAIKGVTYIADADGNPSGPVTPVYGAADIQEPLESGSKQSSSRSRLFILLNVVVVLLIIVALIMKKRSKSLA